MIAGCPCLVLTDRTGMSALTVPFSLENARVAGAKKIKEDLMRRYGKSKVYRAAGSLSRRASRAISKQVIT
jgi:hypothetical protein